MCLLAGVRRLLGGQVHGELLLDGKVFRERLLSRREPLFGRSRWRLVVDWTKPLEDLLDDPVGAGATCRVEHAFKHTLGSGDNDPKTNNRILTSLR